MTTSITAWISLIVVILVIIIGVKTGRNIGILAIAGSFLLGLITLTDGVPLLAPELNGKPITDLFPFSIFWLTLSVSILINIGSQNGTFDIIIKKMIGITGGRRALIPILVYFIMLFICSIGAGSTGVVVLLCTIAATIAKDQQIDPTFILISVMCGSASAVGSPVGTVGIICNEYAKELFGKTIALEYMYPRGVLLGFLSFVLIFLLFRGWELKPLAKEKSEKRQELNKHHWMTLTGILCFAVMALGLKLDMGLSAFFVSAILLLIGCADEKEVIRMVPWNSILMIVGMCILIGVVKLAGGMSLLSELLSLMMNRITVKPLYSIIGSLLSMFSSITAVVLPSMMPTIPDMAAQTGINGNALVTSLAFGSVITCVSPFSSMGAIAMGIMGTNPEWDMNEIFKKLIKCMMILTVAAAVFSAIGFAG